MVGVRVRDLESGSEIDIRARTVINAAGVWIDELHEMLRDPSVPGSMLRPKGLFRVRASKGIHLVVPRDRITSTTGVITRTEKSLLFVIPWGERWIIGTTDTDWELDRAHPAASARTSTTCSGMSIDCSVTRSTETT